MKKLLFLLIAIIYLHAEYNVAKLGHTDGSVYVLRNGKMIQAFQGLSLHENDTIYSRAYSKTKIIFPNGFTHTITNKSHQKISDIIAQNKMSRVKTHKQVQEAIKNSNQDTMENYRFNSKFHKRQIKNFLNHMEKQKEEIHVDEKKNISIQSKTKDVQNLSTSEHSHIKTATIEVAPTAKVKNITIKGKTEHIHNISGKNSSSKAEVGHINVK